MAEAMLLDTSAIMAFIEDEPGADQVQIALFDADADNLSLYACFVTLTEIEYITRQEQREAVALPRLRDLRALPVTRVHSDDALRSLAAVLKASHRISFAGAFVAAAAQRFDAVLIHKDPEFGPLAPNLKQRLLPPKR